MNDRKEKLARCPFCGDNQTRVYRHNTQVFWSVACGGEDCPMSYCLENKFNSEEDCIEFWNTRYSMKYNPENYYHDRDL